jgi:hypothetical protein
MPLPWRAAVCAAPTMLALAGSAYLAHHARSREPGAPAPGEESRVMVAVSPADEDRMHRVALKHEAVMDLLDGRMTFDEAVERFRDVSAGSPEALANLREGGFGTTDEEALVQQLVSFARVQAAHDARRYGPALAQLEEEARSRTSPAVSQ